ncbi:MAG TPA: acylphosphatase [Bacteroidota bacterium]|nr:acylphosphatase [Bacteroidota bacterium]
MDARAHIVVRGLVQGVGFRYFVLMRAQKFALRGYVQNVYNGDVEIEVEGARSLVEEFIGEVKVGPRAAHVSDLRIDWMDLSHAFTTFEVR